MTVATINEASSGTLTIEFLDEAGLPAVPSSISFRIVCVTTGSEFRADTAIAPAASIDLALTPDDTRIVTLSIRIERRRVTLVATFGPGDQLTQDYEFSVRILNYFPGPGVEYEIFIFWFSVLQWLTSAG